MNGKKLADMLKETPVIKIGEDEPSDPPIKPVIEVVTDKKEHTRRCVIVKVSYGDLVTDDRFYRAFRRLEENTCKDFDEVLAGGEFERILTRKFRLPEGARVAKWAETPEKTAIACMVQHESFEPVPEGCMLPVWNREALEPSYDTPRKTVLKKRAAPYAL